RSRFSAAGAFCDRRRGSRQHLETKSNRLDKATFHDATPDASSCVHALFHASATRFSLANLLLVLRPAPPPRQTRTGFSLQDARSVQPTRLVAATHSGTACASNPQAVSQARACNR